MPGATIPQSPTSGLGPQPEGLILADERSYQVVSSVLTDDDPRGIDFNPLNFLLGPGRTRIIDGAWPTGGAGRLLVTSSLSHRAGLLRQQV